MILYTDHLPKRFDGFTIGPLTLIRPSLEHNAALQAHEAAHRAQFDRSPFRGLLYPFSERIRFEYELEAYRASYAADPGGIDDYANSLATKYRLPLTFEQAKAAIMATPTTPA